MVYSKSYIRADEQGALRVGSTGVSLDSVVYAFQQGCSPETIQDQYPALSLEQVYGAIAFYLANRDEVHEYLQQQEKLWQDLCQKTEEQASPVVERLRALRAAAAQGSWFEKVAGSFKDVPEFDEILRLGREFRQADRPPDDA
jgi:uncharacterized protein (DUF433 family)